VLCKRARGCRELVDTGGLVSKAGLAESGLGELDFDSQL